MSMLVRFAAQVSIYSFINEETDIGHHLFLGEILP